MVLMCFVIGTLCLMMMMIQVKRYNERLCLRHDALDLKKQVKYPTGFVLRMSLMFKIYIQKNFKSTVKIFSYSNTVADPRRLSICVCTNWNQWPRHWIQVFCH